MEENEKKTLKERLDGLFDAIKALLNKILNKVLQLEKEGYISEDAARKAKEGLYKCMNGIDKVKEMGNKLDENEQAVLYSAMFEYKNKLESFDKFLDSIAGKEVGKEEAEDEINDFSDSVKGISDRIIDLKENPIAVESMQGFNILETETIKSLVVYENKGNPVVRFKGRPDFFRVVNHENGDVTLDYLELNDAQKESLKNSVVTDEDKITKVKKSVADSARFMKKSESTADKLGDVCLLIANIGMDIGYDRIDGVDKIKISEGKFVNKSERSTFKEIKSSSKDLSERIVNGLNHVKFDMAAKLIEKQAKFETVKPNAYKSLLAKVISKPDTIYKKDDFQCIFNSKDSTFRITKGHGDEVLVLKETEDSILKAELYNGVERINDDISQKQKLDVAEWKEEKTQDNRSQVYFNMKADILDSGYSQLSSLMQSEYAKIIISHRTGLAIEETLKNYKEAREQNLSYDVVSNQYTRDSGRDFTKLPSIDRIGFAQKRLFEQEGNVGGRYNGFSAGKVNRGKSFEIVAPSTGKLYLNIQKNEISSVIFKNSEGKQSSIISKDGKITSDDLRGEKDFAYLCNLACDILTQAGMDVETQRIRGAFDKATSERTERD